MGNEPTIVRCDPLPPVPGVWKVVARYVLEGQQLRNIHHFRLKSGELPADPQAHLAGSYEAWRNANLRQHQAMNLTMTGVDCYDLTTADGAWHSRSQSANGAGGSSWPATANFSTLAISWYTAKRGRNFRGRTFHVGLTVDNVVGNIMKAAHVGPLLAAYEALKTLGTEGNPQFELGIVSYYDNNVCRTAGLFTPVTGCKTDGYLDVQRRRKPGVGM